MKKLDVLQHVERSRAKQFKERFLDIFVQEHPEDVANINEAKQARSEAYKNFDSLIEDPWDTSDIGPWEENYREFEKLTKMSQKRYQLRALFSDKLENVDLSFTETPPNVLHAVILNNPRLVAGMSHTFNLLGTIGATYSVFKEVFTPGSDFRQGDPRAVMSVVATAIGGVGSVKGTFDLLKVLKEKLFGPHETPKTYSSLRTPEELATFEEELVTEVGVDLTNMERASSRLARMAEAKTIGRVFTAFGVVADGIFFGISVYDLYMDFNADTKDDWKIADDFLFAASAGIGAALGK